MKKVVILEEHNNYHTATPHHTPSHALTPPHTTSTTLSTFISLTPTIPMAQRMAGLMQQVM